ncbi:transposase family protein [Streptomyces goshikiensis]|uniref:helix-turn-helix domain-containing protein n=1 Tax=Streptomyces goshikiensis TaxID=1942 RepID=UPI0036A0BCDF
MPAAPWRHSAPTHRAVLATLVHLRHGVSHDGPACWFGADRSTITQAIGEVRPLLAIRGCTGRLLFGWPRTSPDMRGPGQRAEPQEVG